MHKRAGVVFIAVLLAGCASTPAAGPAATGYLSVSVSGDGRGPYRYDSSPSISHTTESTPTPAASSSSPDGDGPVPPAARRFAWTAKPDAIPEAFTLTVLRGLSVRAALATVAPHPDFPVRSVNRTRRAVDRVLAKQDPDDQTAPSPQLVAAVRRGPYTLVLEDNNFLATDAAARLSRRGVATVYFCNVNADTTYTVARAGRVVREIDPLLGDDLVGRQLPEERGLPFAREDVYTWVDAMTLELTRRLTGYRVRPADFEMARYELAVAVAL